MGTKSDFDLIYQMICQAKNFEEFREKIEALAKEKNTTPKLLLQTPKETVPLIFVNNLGNIKLFCFTTIEKQLGREKNEKIAWLSALNAQSDDFTFNTALFDNLFRKKHDKFFGLLQRTAKIEEAYYSALKKEITDLSPFKNSAPLYTPLTVPVNPKNPSEWIQVPNDDIQALLFGYAHAGHHDALKNLLSSLINPKTKEFPEEFVNSLLIDSAIRQDRALFSFLFKEFLPSLEGLVRAVNIDKLRREVSLFYHCCLAVKDKAAIKELQQKAKRWGLTNDDKEIFKSLFSPYADALNLNFRTGLDSKLHEYLKNRESKPVQYYHHGLFSIFKSKSFSLKQKQEAVTALSEALQGKKVDLEKHLPALRNGDLGKTIRKFIESEAADFLFPLPDKDKRTVSAFVQRLHAHLNPEPDKNLEMDV